MSKFIFAHDWFMNLVVTDLNIYMECQFQPNLIKIFNYMSIAFLAFFKFLQCLDRFLGHGCRLLACDHQCFCHLFIHLSFFLQIFFTSTSLHFSSWIVFFSRGTFIEPPGSAPLPWKRANERETARFSTCVDGVLNLQVTIITVIITSWLKITRIKRRKKYSNGSYEGSNFLKEIQLLKNYDFRSMDIKPLASSVLY